LEERAFVIEGPGLVAEAVDAGWQLEAQYVASGAEPVAGAGPAYELARGVLERVATTETPQPVLAVAALPEPDATALARATFVLVADGVGDPGNLGTMLRSAEAAGAELLALTPGSVDPFNPKVVRASAGSLFRLPVLTGVALTVVAEAGLRVVGTSSHRGLAFTDADLTGRVAVVVGSEAHGLDPTTPVDQWVTIPHQGRAESLNVAMAATLLCFEVARQRRLWPDTLPKS
jgi:TrmH family RNA methyltransferase